MRPHGTVDPSQGGCWYCHNEDEDLVFCREFDTYVHQDCAKEAHKAKPDDAEAEIIYRDLPECARHFRDPNGMMRYCGSKECSFRSDIGPGLWLCTPHYEEHCANAKKQGITGPRTIT